MAASPSGRERPAFPLHDPGFYAQDPVDAYRTLRTEAPVLWHEPGSFWALSKHVDVTRVSREPELFTSERGVFIDDIVHPDRVEGREIPGSELMLTTDPPRHRELRKVLSRHFSVQGLTHLEAGIRQLAVANIEAAAGAEGADFVALVSVPTAIQTITLALGLPLSEWRSLKELSASETSAFDHDAFDSAAAGIAAMAEYFGQVLTDRRRSPGDENDWLTTLVGSEVGGSPLPWETQVMFCIDLLVAGNETTDPLLSQGALALWEQPEQRDRLLEDPTRIRGAVDELLRWTTPVLASARQARTDVELRGETIRAGEFVVLLYGSANRDEEVWADPDVLDVERPHVGRQLAFGTGPHVCLGAHLARMEARVLFDELLRRHPSYEVVGAAPRQQSTLVNRLLELPVHLH
jgi:cytochrome P450